jgi:Cupin
MCSSRRRRGPSPSKCLRVPRACQCQRCSPRRRLARPPQPRHECSRGSRHSRRAPSAARTSARGLRVAACRLSVDERAPLTLRAGDFVLIPAARGFVMTSLEPPAAKAREAPPVALLQGGFRLGDPNGPPDVRLLVGHCVFGAPDAALLVSLLPKSFTFGASSGWRPSFTSSERKRVRRGPHATSSWRGCSRCSSLRPFARRLTRPPRQAWYAGWLTRGSRPRCACCISTPPGRGRWRSWPKPPRSLARPSLSASAAPSGWPC